MLASILVASDFSPGARLALDRAVLLAGEHNCRLTVVHVTDDPGEDPVRQAIARLGRELPDRTRAAVTAETGKPFVEIIRKARDVDAELVIVGAHGADSIRAVFTGTTAEQVVRKGDRPVLVVKEQAAGPYRDVLVAIDFSEHSRRAVEFAARLAPSAHHHVLHVAALPGEGRLRTAGLSPSSLRSLRGTVRRETRPRLDAFLTGSQLAPAHTAHLQTGRPEVVIPAAASRLKVDLVAVGTHGMGGLRHVLVGSVAQHVLRDARCDVLAVRTGRVDFELP